MKPTNETTRTSRMIELDPTELRRVTGGWDRDEQRCWDGREHRWRHGHFDRDRRWQWDD